MANIREAFEYAGRNPDSDFAKNLSQLASSGALNLEAKKNGIDLSPFQSKSEPEKKNVAQKIASFTGGEKIAQGLGQALAQKQISKDIEAVQKTQFDLEGQLLKQIKEYKTAGKDTSRLETALGYIANDIYNTGNDAEKLLNPNQLTNKQVIGDALQLATTASAGKVVGAANRLPINGVGLGAGALKGAATGALSGAALGASYGAADGLKDDKDAAGIAQAALGGAAVGGIGGAAIGSVTGAVSGKVKANNIKNENFADELVMPKATTVVKEKALSEGRVTEPSMFSKSKILPSKRDKEIAKIVKPYVSSKKPITENIDSLSQGVREINDAVKTYVKDNKVPFNGNQLKKQLNNGKEELNLIFASDSNAEKTYESVVKEFMKHVKNKDTSGLLDARQEFDKIPAIKKLLDSQGLGENAKKEIVLTARNQANKYIANLLPKGNTYRAQLLQESKMIEALGNMAEKNSGMIGKTKFETLVNDYPILKWFTGLGVGAGVGAGATILGTID